MYIHENIFDGIKQIAFLRSNSFFSFVYFSHFVGESCRTLCIEIRKCFLSRSSTADSVRSSQPYEESSFRFASIYLTLIEI